MSREYSLGYLLFIAFLTMIIGTLSASLYYVTSHSSPPVDNYIDVIDFHLNGTEDAGQSIQQAIDYAYEKDIGQVKLLENKEYLIHSGFTLREGIEMELGRNTRLMVVGDFTVIEVHKNAALFNGHIEVTDAEFQSAVITLDGEQQFWSWQNTQINNVTIVNTTGTYQGIGLSLQADHPGDYISFVNVANLRIIGFEYGIHLRAGEPEQAGDDYNFINGNRFTNITLDDCVKCIEVTGSETIPNESSGNMFTGIQIQLTNRTESALKVNGTDNRFEGIIWDVHELSHDFPIVIFTEQAVRSRFESNLAADYIHDSGYNNTIIWSD